VPALLIVLLIVNPPPLATSKEVTFALNVVEVKATSFSRIA
jgi:hypothetical protein